MVPLFGGVGYLWRLLGPFWGNSQQDGLLFAKYGTK